MRILLINRWYPTGGVGNYIRILSSALANLGHSVTIIAASKHSGRAKERHDDRIPVYSVSYPAVHYYLRRLPGSRVYYRTFETLIYAWNVEKMRRKIERIEGKFDVVEYAEVLAEGLFHGREATPFVVTLHMPTFVFDEVVPSSLGYSTYWVSRWERSFIRRAKGVMSPSHDLAKRVARYCDLPLDQIEIIVNPVNIDEFLPIAKISGSDSVKILFLGYIDEHKGAFLMAEATPIIIERCPQALILFVGQNRTLSNGISASEYLRGIVGQPYLRNIRIMGQVGRNDLKKIIQNADVCVTPSIYENCPYAALDIMASAKPLVATRSSGFLEMVNHEDTGLLFKPGSPKDLAEKVIRFVHSPVFAQQTGQCAREQVKERYDSTIIAQKKLHFYEQSISS